jgi:hypothetical protein
VGSSWSSGDLDPFLCGEIYQTGLASMLLSKRPLPPGIEIPGY